VTDALELDQPGARDRVRERPAVAGGKSGSACRAAPASEPPSSPSRAWPGSFESSRKWFARLAAMSLLRSKTAAREGADRGLVEVAGARVGTILLDDVVDDGPAVAPVGWRRAPRERWPATPAPCPGGRFRRDRGARGHQRQRRHAVAVVQCQALGDAAAHRQPDHVRAVDPSGRAPRRRRRPCPPRCSRAPARIRRRASGVAVVVAHHEATAVASRLQSSSSTSPIDHVARRSNGAPGRPGRRWSRRRAAPRADANDGRRHTRHRRVRLPRSLRRGVV
jgi:hypothetical protein